MQAETSCPVRLRRHRLAPLMEGQFGWPKIDLSETDKALMISVELPG